MSYACRELYSFVRQSGASLPCAVAHHRVYYLRDGTPRVIERHVRLQLPPAMSAEFGRRRLVNRLRRFANYYYTTNRNIYIRRRSRIFICTTRTEHGIARARARGNEYSRKRINRASPRETDLDGMPNGEIDVRETYTIGGETTG